MGPGGLLWGAVVSEGLGWCPYGSLEKSWKGWKYDYSAYNEFSRLHF